MDINQYAKQSKLPLKILTWMSTKNIISNPLSTDDQIGLDLLEKVWCKREIIRSQLSKFSARRRVQFIENSDLETKWERYAYSRFSNLPEGENLSMKKLFQEVEMNFDFNITRPVKERLYKIRRRVYNKRNYSKKIT